MSAAGRWERRRAEEQYYVLKIEFGWNHSALSNQGLCAYAGRQWGQAVDLCGFFFSALPQLSYQRLNDELFQAYEVAGLATALEQLLDGEAAEDYEMICVEPDFTFAFHPVQNGKYETIDSSMDWTVGYWDGDVLEPNSISVRLGRLEIEQMLIYLKLSMGTLNAADPEVQRCMECHAICA